LVTFRLAEITIPLPKFRLIGNQKAQYVFDPDGDNVDTELALPNP
jgi:hypothetical protein